MTIFTQLASRRAPGNVALALGFLCLSALCLYIKFRIPRPPILAVASAHSEGQLRHPAHPTLVIYILSFSDAAYIENFYFFFLEAVSRDNTAHYDILVPKGHRKFSLLPDLPSHARYIEHDRSCRGLSLVRWHLSNRGEDKAPAERVVLVSSAVRGPFIPPGLRDTFTWHVALGSGLDGSGGLGGGVVSCAQPPERWALEGVEPPLSPFLEFTALVASRAAIEELLRLPADQLPDCPRAADRPAAAPAAAAAEEEEPGTRSMEVGAIDTAAVLAMEGLTEAELEAMRGLRSWSSAVLGAGSGMRLSSLAVRQQGVDWSDQRTWACNGGLAPLVERASDGVSLLPYEIMFLPVSEYDDVDMPYGAAAEFVRTYSEWMLAAAEADRGAPHLRSIARQEAATGRPQGATSGGEGGPRASPHSAALPGANVTGMDGAADGGADAAAAAAAAATPSMVVVVPEPDRWELAARNRYHWMSAEYKLAGVLVAVAQGEGCFDADYFLQANPDVVGVTHHEAWKFFVFYAQFQPRPYRLKCGVDWSKYGLRGSGGRRRKGGGGGGGRGAGRRAVAAAAAAEAPP